MFDPIDSCPQTDVHQRVSVDVRFSATKERTLIIRVSDGKRVYKITDIGLQYVVHEGEVLHHIYYAASQTLTLKLDFNTKTCVWHLLQTTAHD